jgi:hypothetical protein
MQHHLAAGEWSRDWLWGLALTVTSTMLHAFGLMMIAVSMEKISEVTERIRPSHPLERFAAAMAGASMSLVVLHGVEAALWAVVLVWLDACPNFRSAIYFSLQMATTLGTDTVQLSDPWRLMGPLEGISGMLLFGLSTAFLFALMQRTWPFPPK